MASPFSPEQLSGDAERLPELGGALLHSGEEVIADTLFLEMLAECYFDAYKGPPWFDTSTLKEIITLIGGHFTAPEDSPKSVVTSVAAHEEGGLVHAYTALLATSNSNREAINKILREAPYFAQDGLNVEDELKIFWSNLENMRKMELGSMIVFIIDTLSHSDHRGERSIYNTMALAAIESLRLGDNIFIAVTTADTAIYQMLDKLGIIEVISRVGGDDGETLLVLLTDMKAIANIFGEAGNQKTNTRAAAVIGRNIREAQKQGES